MLDTLDPRTDELPRPIPLARFGVTETVYYQATQGQAESLVTHRDGSFVRLLGTDEQPYKRTMRVGEEWVKLDFGWTVENRATPAQFILLNNEGQFLQAIPTPAAKAEALSRIVVLGIRSTNEIAGEPTSFARLRPLESLRFEPEPGKVYYARCLTGIAKITEVLLPGDTL